MGLLRPKTGRLPWARSPGPFGRRGPPSWPGCGGDGGVGPTLVSYLCGAEARAVGIVVATTATVAAVVDVAVAAKAGVGAAAVAATAVGSGPGLDLPAGGGVEWRTQGLRLCPSCVLTMLGLEKGKRRRTGGGEF